MSDDDLQDQWHRAAYRELEARVKGRKFLVQMSACLEPGNGGAPDAVAPDEWQAMAESTEEWLASLNPATLDKDAPPQHEVTVSSVRFELSATPKKAKQGTGSLIANPFPGIVTFTGSHAATPTEPFDAES